MKLILFALISFSWSSQVIPIHKYLTNKTCTQQLRAKILPFTSGDPEYQTSEGFLKSMKESSANELYFFSHSPEFSRRSGNRWRMIPDLNGHDSLYILKVLVHESEVSDGYRIKNDWSNSDLRSLGRLITFTRIRISPFFGVLKSAIDLFRESFSDELRRLYPFANRL